MTSISAFESDHFNEQFNALSVESQATVNSLTQRMAALVAKQDIGELNRMMRLIGTIYQQIAEGLERPECTLH